MFGAISGLGSILASLFKSHLRLEAENLALRHQLNDLRRVGRAFVAGTGSCSSGCTDGGRES